MPTEGEPCRIIHGDALEVLPALTTGEVAYVLTDPPYGVSLASHGSRFRGMRAIEGDGAFATSGRAAKASRPTEPAEVGQRVIDLCQSRGWPVCAFAAPELPWRGDWRQHLVWDKGGAVGIGGDRRTCWKFSWELIQVGQFPKVFGSRDSSVLTYPMMPGDSEEHPAAKSLPLMRYLVRKLVPPGGLALDPFGGSGTTAIAALKEGRRCLIIEKDAGYCDIIRRRVADAMGEGKGSLFAQSTLFG